MPANAPDSAAILYSTSYVYRASDGWIRGQNWGTGVSLKLAVNASLVPEPATASLFVGGLLLLLVIRIR